MILLTRGPVHTLTQDTIYALPARKVRIHTSAAVEVNNSSGTTGWVLLSSSTTGVDTAAAFVRCTTANATITCKS